MPGEQVHQQRGLGTPVHQRAQREGHHPTVLRGLHRLVVLRERFTGHEVDAAAQHPPEVLVAPHHALGVAGRATGVDDVEVVRAAVREVPLRALPRQRLGPGHPRVRRDVGVVVRVCRVGHHDDRPQLRMLARARGHQRRVGPLVDQGHEVGIVEEVVELGLDVAVVHVDRDGPDLEDRQHRDDVLDAVLRVDPDVVAGADPLGAEEVRQPVGLGLELGVGDGAVVDLQGRAPRRRVDRMLEEVSDVQSHVARLEHVLVLG